MTTVIKSTVYDGYTRVSQCEITATIKEDYDHVAQLTYQLSNLSYQLMNAIVNPSISQDTIDALKAQRAVIQAEIDEYNGIIGGYEI